MGAVPTPDLTPPGPRPRDLSGNKRTNKEQGFDQDFTAFNKALQLSCTKGYPVRVVRSYKDKHSQYAPARLIKDPPPTRPGAAAPLARRGARDPS